MSERSRILVIDDEKNYLLVLQTLLEDGGYTVTAVNDPETALAFLSESEVDVVVTDMKMPRVSGQEVLQRVKKNWPYIPVLIMTAFGSIESAVEVMKYGAFNYITKPFSNEELLLSVHNAVELAQAHRQYRLLQEAMQDKYGVHQIVGCSRAIRDVLVMVGRAAPSRATVLITGESGTGKELVARAVHYTSPRKDKPFLKINCAALPESIIESELFGHEKGAFTGAIGRHKGRFEQASGGTLFLDEIGELPPQIQVKLLRVLQEREFERVGGTETRKVDVRLIAATNRNLENDVREGRFREDLFYRLNVFQITPPPLRERKADIMLLADYLTEKYAAKNGKLIKRISQPAIDLLTSYDWPGNVRELENCIERAVILARDMVLHSYNLPPSLQSASSTGTGSGSTLDSALSRLEKEMIIDALKTSSGNISVAANQLGITERQMGLRLRHYGINRRLFRPWWTGGA